jgi:hypothetical protein
MEITHNIEDLVEKLNKLIESHKIQLNYKIVDETYVDEIVEFVNTHYFDKDGNFPLIYTKELMMFYLKDSMPIYFYTKNNPNKKIGLIIGKQTESIMFGKKLRTFEGNFFCIIPQLRKLTLPRIIISQLVLELIKKHNIKDVLIIHYTTGNIINNKPICNKTYVHRYINFDELYNLEQICKSKYTPLHKKYYSKFAYPDHFKKFKISTTINENQYDEIANKINLYNKERFDIYEYISNINIKYINDSDMFYKFIVSDNNNNIAFINFYRLDILNKNKNKHIRTLYLHYYFCDENIVDYLELIGEYLYKNNICDMFLINLFDENVPSRYVKGNGILYYNLYNVNHFDIKEQKIKYYMI